MSLKKQFSKDKCKVTFTLPKKAAIGATEVKLVGDFNKWNPAKAIKMKALKNEFKAVVELPVGNDYQFRYLINDKVWENDWKADNYVSTPFGVDNSVVYVREGIASVKTVKKASTAKTSRTGKTQTKKSSTSDDLKKIEGIGPKVEKIFNEAGITSWSILSKTKISTLKAILSAAGPRYKSMNPSTWTKQAKMAANGKWEALSKWQDELTGGQ